MSRRVLTLAMSAAHALSGGAVAGAAVYYGGCCGGDKVGWALVLALLVYISFGTYGNEVQRKRRAALVDVYRDADKDGHIDHANAAIVGRWIENEMNSAQKVVYVVGWTALTALVWIAAWSVWGF